MFAADTYRPLSGRRMDQRTRERRKDLDRRLADLRDRALSAYDDGRDLVATIHIRTDRHGAAAGTVVVMDAPAPAAELRRVV